MCFDLSRDTPSAPVFMYEKSISEKLRKVNKKSTKKVADENKRCII